MIVSALVGSPGVDPAMNLFRLFRKRRRPKAAPEFARLPWSAGEASFRQKAYESYEQYQRHQVSKLEQLDLAKYDAEYREALRERLRKLDVVKRGDSVLCLGARIGTECKAFIDLGAFPIGVDLNPGEGNRYVVVGDFHDLQFADGSIDWVFTNALDHAFDLDKMMAEAVRVLRPGGGGGVIAEIVGGSKDDHGRNPGQFESLWWDEIDDVFKALARHGLVVERKSPFHFPWKGHLALLRLQQAGEKAAAKGAGA